MSGGIKEVVETLGLKQEYENYLRDVDGYIATNSNEMAAICIGDFSNFCKKQLEENFYLFK